MRGLVFIAFISCAFAGPLSKGKPIVPTLDGRIVGGVPVEIVDFPYQISLQYFSSHFCGGSIISEKWVVTAAHCVEGMSASVFSLRIASTFHASGGVVVPVAEVIMNPLYDSNTVDFDVAVLRVDEPFALGQPGINTIGLPEPGTTPEDGVKATVSGWGITNSGSLPYQLQAVVVRVVSRDNCRLAYGDWITDNMMCAGYPEGGKDACQGDSGGPLTVEGVLVGIVSWGMGCGVPSFPGVYSDVGSLRSWITENTGV